MSNRKLMNSKTTLLSTFFTVLLLFGTASCSFGQQANSLESDLDAKLAELMDKYNLQGLAASVSFTDGSVWSGAASPTSNITEDMLFEMGSNTKTFTAAIIVQMAQDGELSLSDTLGQFLDDIENIDMGVTVKQLLNHTAGTYSYTNHVDFGTDINANPGKIVLPNEILEKYIEPMRFEPGTKWRYSNTNYLLLGLIIEAVDERPYEESLRKRIFEPLDMEHSYLDIFEEYSDPRSGTWLTTGYLDEEFTSFMSSAWAAGGVVSTTADLATWAHKLYTGQVLDQAWTDSMTTLAVVNGEEQDYGLGMFFRKYKGTPLYGHGGTTLQHSTMEYSSEYDFSLVMVINEQARGGASTPVQNEMLDFLMSKPWGLSTPENQSPAASLFPNPAKNSFRITTNVEEGELLLMDMAGKTVLNTPISGSASIDLSNVQQGTYMALLRGADGATLFRERLVRL